MNSMKMVRVAFTVLLLLVTRGIAGDDPALLPAQEEEALKARILDESADFQTRANSLDRYVRLGYRRSQAWLLKQMERFPPRAALYRVVLRDIRAQPMDIVKPGAPPGSERRTRAVIRAVIEVEMMI